MKVAIVGSREYPDLNFVRRYVRLLAMKHPGITVISGGARGVDTVAVQEAKRCGLPVEVYKADWNTHGRGAGFIRNAVIVDNADVVISFWDGQSRGTQHTVRLARERKKIVREFIWEAK
jgi:hypothetical protein